MIGDGIGIHSDVIYELVKSYIFLLFFETVFSFNVRLGYMGNHKSLEVIRFIFKWFLIETNQN
jgi:hypothetical protein